MIAGSVTAQREATVNLIVRGPTGKQQEIQGLIDTGFDGSLSLTPRMIAALELSWLTRQRAILADGSESIFDSYEAIVIWDGAPQRVSAHQLDVAPLVGMTLLYGYELTLEIVEGGNVIIKALT